MDVSLVDEVLEECIHRGLYSANEFSDIVQHVKRQRQRQVNKTDFVQESNIKSLSNPNSSVLYTKTHTRELDGYLEVLEGVSK